MYHFSVQKELKSTVPPPHSPRAATHICSWDSLLSWLMTPTTWLTRNIDQQQMCGMLHPKMQLKGPMAMHPRNINCYTTRYEFNSDYTPRCKINSENRKEFNSHTSTRKKCQGRGKIEYQIWVHTQGHRQGGGVRGGSSEPPPLPFSELLYRA